MNRVASALTAWALCCTAAPAAEFPLPSAKPEDLGLSAARLAEIDQVVNDAIERRELPGAVVLVLHRGRVAHRKAYGLRSKEPEPVPMTADTVFDLASLTKPVATATSVFVLVQKGKLRLSDRVAQHWPEFRPNGKDKLTVEHLLLHTSGLIADNPLADYRDGRDKALERICQLTPLAEPEQRFVYSDVNFIVLGELVERLGGAPLDVFAQEYVFKPLGMKDTGFRPDDRLKGRCAPTEKRDGRWLQGEVHDPRAALLGGVAGHAGLFGTADDLALYADMLLNHGGRILSSLTFTRMTDPHEVPGGLRSLGWDVDTSFSSNRGELFARGRNFGHTGFTGTSIWVDPGSETAVIFLSNRVHPDGKGNVTRLRGQVATLVAASLPPLSIPDPPRYRRPARRPVGAPGRVATGLDMLVKDGFAQLKGRKVGLVTNHTGIDRDGRSAIDLLHKAPGVTLVALFSPEHGIRGALDEKVSDSKDAATGLPVYSLYGERRKPSAETLKGIDTLVYYIQDAGCRFYTYISTLGLVMEAAAENKVRVVVLDRPNPIGGVVVDGPVLDAGRESFVAYHKLPVRHGLTVAELAQLFNAERKLGCDLEVVRMTGWRRGDLYDRTGLSWVNPSPNLRNPEAALLYPGVGLLETTNLSVGRGTDRPFEWVGAPWMDGRKVAAALANEGLPGVRFVPAKVTPSGSVHKGKECGGVQVLVDDWETFRPLRTGLTMALVLRKLYPDDWQVQRYDVLLLHKETFEAVKRGAAWAEIETAWQPELERFKERRRAYLLYPE